MGINIDYSIITESPGLRASQEQIAKLYQRYHFTSHYAEARDVLEVACGTGLGLGYTAKKARRIVGGDIDKSNVRIARKIFLTNHQVDILVMNAHKIPFSNASFDLVVLFEALYYLKQAKAFVYEANRVLRESGILLICTDNRDSPDFVPSPYAYKYFSVPELYLLLEEQFDEVQIYGGFKIDTAGIRSKTVRALKRVAANLNLIPRSLAARAYLKRLFLGPLKPIPNEVFENMAPYEAPIPITPDEVSTNYRIIYAVAQKNK